MSESIWVSRVLGFLYRCREFIWFIMHWRQRCVGHIYELTIEEIKAGIESLEAISGRFKMIETDKMMIVDDCYNANPMSMKASLDVLHDGSGRRVAILGDMGELGENETALHEEVGVHAAVCGIDVCVCVGELSSTYGRSCGERPVRILKFIMRKIENLFWNILTGMFRQEIPFL